MTDSEHPATTLASTLERIQMLLRSLNTFYDQPREAFALQPNFIMMSLGVAESCVTQANEALSALMQHCDLTLLPALVDEQEAEHGNHQPKLDEDHLEVTAELSAPFEDEAPMAADSDPTLAVEEAKHFVQSAEKTKSGPSEQFAKTYLELLQKLTAAEIFATEQQALSPTQSQQQPLLPLLRSLRQDIQKLHNVA